MITATSTRKKTVLLKSVKDNVKKTLSTNVDGNYLIKKVNNTTGILISSNVLSSDLFDIQQVVEYFTKY